MNHGLDGMVHGRCVSICVSLPGMMQTLLHCYDISTLLKVASSMGSVATSLGGVDSKEAMVTGVDSE